MRYEKAAVLLLAGGQNRRMQGRRKADLSCGDETFLDHIVWQFAQAGLSQIYLSVDDASTWKESAYPLIEDEVRRQGPLGGIVSGFHAIDKDAIFVCATDMPAVEPLSICRLFDTWAAANVARPCVAETRYHIHPLFGIYPRTCLPVMEKMLAQGDYRMMHLLKETNAAKVFFDDGTAFANINSPEDLAELAGRRKESNSSAGSSEGRGGEKYDPRIIAVSGASGSGKTRLLEKLIPEMRRRGQKVAVIKHDGHDFECDRPGTDSDRLFRAGAYGAAVYSGGRIFVHKEEEEPRLEELIWLFPEADIIFVEGAKDRTFSKIETVRAGERLVTNPDGRFLVVTDTGRGTFSGTEEVMSFEDIERIADRIEEVLAKKRGGAQ